jgi:phosphoglucomutase
MALHPLAGKPAPVSMRPDIPRLVAAFYDLHPDPRDPAQRVSFGTSGHRGVSFRHGFNRDHIRAITQAVCELRAAEGVTGPLFLGMDTHALSFPAFSTALEVLAANGVEVMVQRGLGPTPTPVISHAILTWNRGRDRGLADGVVITPSHNPPDNGGFKYDPPHGGPADTDVTGRIQARANELLAQPFHEIPSMPYERALRADSTHEHDYVEPYVADLAGVIDFDVIRGAKLRLGVDPMGGSGIGYWDPIVERYGIDIEVVRRDVEPDFRFMTVDHDGKVRMDCSSPHAMASLVELRDRFDVAFGNDPDYDRHGIVTRAGLMNPNHVLAAAIAHLLERRSGFRADSAVGKTLVSSSMIDRVVQAAGRRLHEVPVGFKWFVRGLIDGTLCFGGEESAGATFLRRDGTVWTTDKDGIVMDLLAAEITAVAGKDPAEVYTELTRRHGTPLYERIDAPATAAQRAVLEKLSPAHVTADTLAGEPIEARLTTAPGNGASIGGLKVVARNGWFAARPSGTEDVCKVYTESFLGPDHLVRVQEEARAIVAAAFRAAGV